MISIMSHLFSVCITTMLCADSCCTGQLCNWTELDMYMYRNTFANVYNLTNKLKWYGNKIDVLSILIYTTDILAHNLLIHVIDRCVPPLIKLPCSKRLVVIKLHWKRHPYKSIYTNWKIFSSVMISKDMLIPWKPAKIMATITWSILITIAAVGYNMNQNLYTWVLDILFLILLCVLSCVNWSCHYSDIIRSVMASEITSLSIVYSTVCCLCRHISKETSLLHFIGLCEGNSPVTSEFPPQRVSNTENVCIWRQLHDVWGFHYAAMGSHCFHVTLINTCHAEFIEELWKYIFF